MEKIRRIKSIIEKVTYTVSYIRKNPNIKLAKGTSPFTSKERENWTKLVKRKNRRRKNKSLKKKISKTLKLTYQIWHTTNSLPLFPRRDNLLRSITISNWTTFKLVTQITNTHKMITILSWNKSSKISSSSTPKKRIWI